VVRVAVVGVQDECAVSIRRSEEVQRNGRYVGSMEWIRRDSVELVRREGLEDKDLCRGRK
jgi:hypothetical protein